MKREGEKEEEWEKRFIHFYTVFPLFCDLMKIETETRQSLTHFFGEKKNPRHIKNFELILAQSNEREVHVVRFWENKI
jgi:hypothetical protein